MSTDNELIKTFFYKMHDNDFNNIFKIIISSINSYNKNLWLVGGQVRDYYLNISSADIDFATDCDMQIIYSNLAKNDLLVTNMKYYSKFHTLSIKGKNNKFDIAQLRNEIYKKDSIIPVINFHRSIINDLQRRDFTINALAIKLNNNNDFKIIDPYNGLQDIKHRVLRSLHSNSYINDPKRIFRAARYSARYNLNISKKEVGSIILGMNNMHLLTKQQIDKEKQLINNEDNHVQSFALLKEWGYH